MDTNINDIDTVRLNDAGDAIEIIDQTLLPGRDRGCYLLRISRIYGVP